MLRRDLDDHERRMAKLASVVSEMKNARYMLPQLERWKTTATGC